MQCRHCLLLCVVMFIVTSVWAQKLGVHAGYYGNEVNKIFVGADLMIPFGPVALMPNVDYTKSHGDDNWWASGDVVLRVASSGATGWVGAGSTYAYFSCNENSGVIEHIDGWGWDATAGLEWTFAGFKPYATARFIKVKDEKMTGATIGLRF